MANASNGVVEDRPVKTQVILRIGFCGMLYSNYNKELQKIVYANIEASLYYSYRTSHVKGVKLGPGAGQDQQGIFLHVASTLMVPGGREQRASSATPCRKQLQRIQPHWTIQPNKPEAVVTVRQINVGAIVIRIGFWGVLCYNYNKEPPKLYYSNKEPPKIV